MELDEQPPKDKGGGNDYGKQTCGVPIRKRCNGWR